MAASLPHLPVNLFNCLCFAILVILGSLSAVSPMRTRVVENKTDNAIMREYNEKVVTYIYTRRNPTTPQRLRPDQPGLLDNSNFDPLVPTKMLIHGWLSNQMSGMGGTLLREAILEIADYNVIVMDWSAMDSINYISSRIQVPRLGKYVASMIRQLQDRAGMELSDLHLIGHSLGAHIMSYAAKEIGMSRFGHITGLDPAGPLFWDNANMRLDASDAAFVDVLHSCGKYLGYMDPIGHADFYPNGGTWAQPGCGWDVGGSCSHCRAYAYYLEAIEKPGSFIGTRCDSWQAYRNGDCRNNAKEEFGMGGSKRARGVFFFETNKLPPYSTTNSGKVSDRISRLGLGNKC